MEREKSGGITLSTINNKYEEISINQKELSTRVSNIESKLDLQEEKSEKDLDTIKSYVDKEIDDLINITDGIRNDMNHIVQNILIAVIIAIVTYFVQHIK